MKNTLRLPLATLLLVAAAAPPVRAQSIHASVDRLTSAPIGIATKPAWSLAPGVPWAQPAGVRRYAARALPPGAAASVTRSRTARVILGVLGGLVAGAYLGAKIEGHRCACDDPGLTGAMIGAPLGAVAGGILAREFW